MKSKSIHDGWTEQPQVQEQPRSCMFPPATSEQIAEWKRAFSDRHSAGLGEWIKSGHNRSALD